MKIISYNVNGIRAALNKGLAEWLLATDADCICMQEVKATSDQVNSGAFENVGYGHHYWHSAQKKGYSGVAIFSKTKPKYVHYGCGHDLYDAEGRVIRADFENFSLLNVYMPSGSSGEERQGFKFGWLDFFYKYIHELKKELPRLVVCGDFNICHQAIDIHNPKSNANSSGFLPQEREWMSKYFDSGFVDTFRHFNNEPHHYTWWSNRSGARQKNLGWRIDYFTATENMKQELKRSVILKNAIHSDHCPILLEIEKPT
ncbi:MAG TPA: exodeoxyribonuclease III [Cytophagales bacterium]|nr:exodeoxyribonuclease III [Cytophagales bacterium]